MGTIRKTWILGALTAASVAAAALAASPAAAAQLFATSYSMPNGDGTAHGGSFNYWDLAYSGSGMTNVDGAALSGGLGDLTDGVVASDFWFNTESLAGTGPYVGWYGASGVRAPLITFNFAGPVALDSIFIHIDNSGSGGVFAPEAILVNGVARTFTAPALGSIGTVELSGLGLTGSSHSVQFIQAFDQNAWVFASEVSFFGRAADGGIPEPSTWAMLILGFGGAGVALRRRRAQPA